ncbi:MAG: 2-amino-4-hydroxy-6-hydroxymethyldihydropteridine diphosphokinase [Candidatus Omnitrophota bacterium]|nr:2-amino-4-hydroxy-6-hydroxymethyldihydropteridine diphosphokinase [Candidatus Omnitrophota bacterium]
MTVAYIGLGSNLGGRRKNILSAIKMIGAILGTRVTKVSTIIETVPVGGPPQGKFLNAVAEIQTNLACRDLLTGLQSIEGRLGRVRGVLNGPRSIDLDILFFNDQTIHEKDLIVPHPRIKERDFVLGPLKEIAPVVAAKI